MKVFRTLATQHSTSDLIKHPIENAIPIVLPKIKATYKRARFNCMFYKEKKLNCMARKSVAAQMASGATAYRHIELNVQPHYLERREIFIHHIQGLLKYIPLQSIKVFHSCLLITPDA